MPYIKQARNIWMRQIRKDLPLLLKQLPGTRSVDVHSEQLDGNLLADLSVGPFGRVDAPHPTVSNQVQKAIRSTVHVFRKRIFKRLADGSLHDTIEKIFFRIVIRQQGLNKRTDFR
jgi:hypothetical protein